MLTIEPVAATVAEPVEQRSERASLVALIALFVAFRLGALLSYRPGGYVVDWTERYFFAGWLRYVDAGYLPYRDFWMEYPPLLPWFGIVTYWLSQWLPPWRDPTLWFSLTTGLPLLAVDAASLLLVYLLARTLHGERLALVAAGLSALLFVPLYFFLSGYDGPAVLATLLVLWLAVRGGGWRVAVLAGVVLGLGMQYKLLPIVAGPAAFFAFRARRQALLFGAATVVTNLVVALPFLIQNPAMTFASYASIFTRSSWETIWALIDGYYGGGLVAPIDTRFDAAVATLPQHAGIIPSGLVLAIAALALGWLLTRRHDWTRPRTILGLGFLTLIVVFLASKGYSTQFLVYPLPFLLILWPSARGLAYAVILSVVNVLEWPFWLALFGENAPILAALVLIRTALFVASAIECWRFVRDDDRSPVGRVALSLAGTAVAVLAAAMIGTYVRDSYQRDPYQALIGVLNSGSGPVIFTDETLYRDVRPFSGWRRPLLLVDNPTSGQQATIRDGLAGPGVSLVFAGTDADRAASQHVETDIASDAFLVGVNALENARIATYAYRRGESSAVRYQFEGGFLIDRFEVQRSVRQGEPIAVALDLRLAGAPREVNVFVHLLNRDTIVSQSDGAPVAGLRPTALWADGYMVTDRRMLRTETVQPGQYRLVAGLYFPDGRRLRVIPDADRIDLGTVEVRP